MNILTLGHTSKSFCDDRELKPHNPVYVYGTFRVVPGICVLCGYRSGCCPPDRPLTERQKFWGQSSSFLITCIVSCSMQSISASDRKYIDSPNCEVSLHL